MPDNKRLSLIRNWRTYHQPEETIEEVSEQDLEWISAEEKKEREKDERNDNIKEGVEEVENARDNSNSDTEEQCEKPKGQTGEPQPCDNDGRQLETESEYGEEEEADQPENQSHETEDETKEKIGHDEEEDDKDNEGRELEAYEPEDDEDSYYYDDYDDDEDHDDEDDEEGYTYEEDNGNAKSNEEFSLGDNLPNKRLGTVFAQLVEHIAEELGIEDAEGDDFWDMRKLLKRSINPHIPLSECKKGKLKEKIVLILDTSGSCAWLAEFYSQIAQVAIEHGLVELYTAPNGIITAKWDKKKKSWTQISDDNGVESTGVGDWNTLFENRTIIFFGDFDGADSVIEASWNNKIFWFSSEERYADTTEHSWCHYALDSFRGDYLTCYGASDFVTNTRLILKRLSPSTRSQAHPARNSGYEHSGYYYNMR